jgi:2-phospho-L-lactate transferase/gluconeogenesis factor (CofD/UPF0052 family)
LESKKLKKLNVVLFSGGRGASNIARALNSHSQISLTVAVNAYDDGLSTGRLRRFIPGMLGPSDVRKNICTLIDTKTEANQALFDLMEYRFPLDITNHVALNTIKSFNLQNNDLVDMRVEKLKSFLRHGIYLYICSALDRFYHYYTSQVENGGGFDFKDASFGNIVFAGVYLSHKECFNSAIDNISDVFGISSRVINTTTGENRVLTALKSDGEYLFDESSIVSPQSSAPIESIFLLENYIEGEELRAFNKLSKDQKLEKLKDLNSVPATNTDFLGIMESADIIIYGPGTQHSSLFPTYIQNQIGSAIAKSSAQKIFIANISHDHDIVGWTIDEILTKFLWYINQYGKINYQLTDLVTSLIINKDNEKIEENIQFRNLKHLPDEIVKIENWSDKSGKHEIGKIANQILAIAKNMIETKLRPYRNTISIIVPVLNEEKTIEKTIHDLEALSFEEFNLNKEIVYVDGGSADHSLSILKKYKASQVIESKCSGRGEAMSLGIQRSIGEILVFYPADLEYNINDINRLIQPIIHHDFTLVFGSRSIKSDEPLSILRKIYDGNYLMIASSYIGNSLLSLLALFTQRRYISDMTTSFLAFDRALIAKRNIKSKDLDINVELFVRARKERLHILEVPVSFNPRAYRDGKKTGIKNGLRALMRFLNA